ncbi:MAG: hypothetical protein UR78_C0015G0023 [Candidatus Moranbacteria bacterium GW2011_GWF2_35_39]|nr:MAG: hypothetical protein UR78_C0015G0023 [Candidatus Moranbacteria bacterium GW2011_GWF2_35_39]
MIGVSIKTFLYKFIQEGFLIIQSIDSFLKGAIIKAY